MTKTLDAAVTVVTPVVRPVDVVCPRVLERMHDE